MLGGVIRTVIILAIMGGAFGALLSIASRVFHVKMDGYVVNVLDALLRINCGACGFPGCEGLVSAIVVDEAAVNACAIGGQEVADKVADVVGINAGNMEREVAVVHYQGDYSKAKNRYNCEGLANCRLISSYVGGSKSCGSSYLGGGTCTVACEFDAIHIINGIAQVDKEKCATYRKCIDIYPKSIIGLMSYKQKIEVKCSTKDPGRIIRTNCSIGCVAYRLCEKNCPKDATHVEDNLARIDYDRCVNYGICAARCPIGAVLVEYPERVEKIKEAAKRKAAATVTRKEEEMTAAWAKAATGTLGKETGK